MHTFSFDWFLSGLKHSPLLSNLSTRPGFSLGNLGSLSSKENEFKISIPFFSSAPFNFFKISRWTWFFKGDATRLKSCLALRLISKRTILYKSYACVLKDLYLKLQFLQQRKPPLSSVSQQAALSWSAIEDWDSHNFVSSWEANTWGPPGFWTTDVM